MPKPLPPGDVDAHLLWVRDAVHDRQIDVRVILEALIDVLDAVVDLIPGRPAR